MQDVLILGDWFVDDYWLTRQGSGETSGLEGAEYLIAHGEPRNTKVLALCGAGRVARMLYWLGRFEQDGRRMPHGSEALRVFGLGLWARVDTCRVFKLFHPTYGKGMNPYTMVGGIEPEDWRRLDELDGLFLQSLWQAVGEAPPEFTPRVFRIYKSVARRPLKLDRRIDFEPRILGNKDEPYRAAALSELLLRVGRAKWHSDEFAACVEHFRSALQKHFEYVKILERSEILPPPAPRVPTIPSSEERAAPFSHVVVADHGRGVISPTLLDELQATKLVTESTRWYILTKSALPRWFEELKTRPGVGKVALLYYHPGATGHLRLKTTAGETAESIESWLISCGERPGQPPLEQTRARLTQDAFLTLTGNDQVNWTDDALLVATPNALQVAGLARQESEWKWEIGIADREERFDEPQVGRSSAFFARLAAWAILCAGEYDPWDAVQDAREQARSYVRNMVAHFRDRLEDRDPGSEDAFPIGVDTQPPKVESVRGKRSSLTDSQSAWLSLSSPLADPSAKCLELWRAMQDVPDYVAIDSRKRAEIRRLQRGLREFVERPERSRQTYAAMITAQPGSGKTTLVKKLAEMHKLNQQECNLTQILDRTQLLSFLDRLAHVQSGTDQPLLVFVDEINTPVAGRAVYDVFLSVLSGGTFGTAGDVRRLRSAAWLFVGTSPLKTAEEASPDLLASKEPDFRNRMSAPDISLEVQGESLWTEMFFVCMVKLYDRGVRRVTRGLMQAVWHRIREKTTLRDIEKLIDALRNLPAERALRVRDIDPSPSEKEDLTEIRLEREPAIRLAATPR